MTPFRNDAQNPFGRRSEWPTLPQTPLPVRRWRKAGARAPLSLEEVIVVAAEPEPIAAGPFAAPKPQLLSTDHSSERPARRSPRLLPLIAAAAVGVCGLATLFLAVVRP